MGVSDQHKQQSQHRERNAENDIISAFKGDLICSDKRVFYKPYEPNEHDGEQ